MQTHRWMGMRPPENPPMRKLPILLAGHLADLQWLRPI